MKRIVPFCLASLVWVAGCSETVSTDDSVGGTVDPGSGDQAASSTTLAFDPLTPRYPTITFDPTIIQPIPGATDPLPADPTTEPPPSEPPPSEPPVDETPSISETPTITEVPVPTEPPVVEQPPIIPVTEQPPVVPSEPPVTEQPPIVPETTIVPELPPPVVPSSPPPIRLVEGNPTCEEMFPGSVSYTLEGGKYPLQDGTHKIGSLTVTIDLDGDSVSFTSSGAMVGVIVKGGTAANVYTLDSTSGTGTTPYGHDVSHLTFCVMP